MTVIWDGFKQFKYFWLFQFTEGFFNTYFTPWKNALTLWPGTSNCTQSVLTCQNLMNAWKKFTTSLKSKMHIDFNFFFGNFFIRYLKWKGFLSARFGPMSCFHCDSRKHTTIIVKGQLYKESHRFDSWDDEADKTTVSFVCNLKTE